MQIVSTPDTHSPCRKGLWELCSLPYNAGEALDRVNVTAAAHTLTTHESYSAFTYRIPCTICRHTPLCIK